MSDQETRRFNGCSWCGEICTCHSVGKSNLLVTRPSLAGSREKAFLTQETTIFAFGKERPLKIYQGADLHHEKIEETSEDIVLGTLHWAPRQRYYPGPTGHLEPRYPNDPFELGCGGGDPCDQCGSKKMCNCFGQMEDDYPGNSRCSDDREFDDYEDSEDEFDRHERRYKEMR